MNEGTNTQISELMIQKCSAKDTFAWAILAAFFYSSKYIHWLFEHNPKVK